MSKQYKEVSKKDAFQPPGNAERYHLVKKKLSNCIEHGCRGKRQQIQRKSLNKEELSDVPPIAYDVLQSHGQTLNPTTRAFFEQRFDYDFSKVRIHTDSAADRAAQMTNARAFTWGTRIFFRDGEYRPESASHSRVLIHELAHIIQQARGGSAPPHLLGSSLEQSADRATKAYFNHSGPIQVTGSSMPGIALKPASVPRSLGKTLRLRPRLLDDDELRKEIAAIKNYLNRHLESSEERANLEITLRRLEEELARRTKIYIPETEILEAVPTRDAGHIEEGPPIPPLETGLESDLEI